MQPLTRFIVCIILVFCFCASSAAEDLLISEFGSRTLQYRDEGTDVVLLQFRLSQIGYYKGRIDGIFGLMTKKAVTQFQKDQGLESDGVVGLKTYNAIPDSNILPTRGDYSYEDLILLARVIHAEARGESTRGQVAVGAVILNRVDSSHFPDTIREVVLQEGQFCTLSDGQVHLYPSTDAIEAAKAAILGYDPSNGALFFYNPKIAAKWNWVAGRPISKRIGSHIFAY